MCNLGSLLEEIKSNNRNWSQEDIDSYFALSNEEEREDYSDGQPCFFRDYRPGDDIEEMIARTGTDDLSDFLEEGYCVQVLEESGKIYGAIVTRREGDSTYIGAIAVDNEMEGNGYMGELIDAVFDGSPLVAKVSDWNTRARAAFEKYGFRSRENGNGWEIMVRG